MNTDAERKVIEIRCRAERRAGQLLKEMAAKGQRRARGEDGSNQHVSKPQTSSNRD